MSFMIIWMMMNSFLFLILKHPLTNGLTLLIQTILVSLMSGFMNLEFWYSYILFLIMIGGMLILFIYMTSIVSNEKFNFNNLMFLLISSMSFFMLLTLMIDSSYLINLLNLTDMNLMNHYNWNSMNKYFNYPNSIILMMMISYLFITLIAIIKIISLSHGPLRKKF